MQAFNGAAYHSLHPNTHLCQSICQLFTIVFYGASTILWQLVLYQSKDILEHLNELGSIFSLLRLGNPPYE